ncbi:metal ABC transporter permease [Curtobacterium sp. MCBD17_034]|uniref:metal ABC transporter permease n=1 Tax=unclassified Curtobacterium TaxID=257496 RepID=UPI000DA7A449|nr:MULTISPECIES: metal ABC transporter permease [unclassified Curtobacterium]PZE76183.1 metal ABC transporter permease [Curtobacterium sp. MCBD17_019]PZF60171.1 metal ABC transporter permease [Curtobacterium sp. MCBD17_034]PZF61767.1 metal ABC transporter permease [Curtobacterium sp. MCBD17_013]PZM34856.1 metal ABC transporter permease [Curtobacterium sp. MCBD17_031]
MFAPFMLNAWLAGTIVALIAGIVGFFVVLRGNSFLAHAVPHGAFAGAAGAVLIGVDPLIGLGVFAAGGAFMISALGRRARSDVVTALTLVSMLGLGALFLSRSTEYSAEVFALLFGQILGVSSLEITPMIILGAVCLITLGVTYRPLLLASTLPDTAPSRGVSPQAMSILFGLILACATTMSVPIVGALLMFALLVGPPAAARFVTRRPATAIPLSAALAVAAVWGAISLAYVTDWPVGFFVTAISALMYLAGRLATVRPTRGRTAA